MARRPVVALACLGDEFAETLADYLDRRGYEVVQAAEEWELRSLLAAPQIDVIVVGEGMAPPAVLGLLRRLQNEADPAVMLLRPKTELVETVLALELGAADVVDMPADLR